jgi:hypothetical protein
MPLWSRTLAALVPEGELTHPFVSVVNGANVSCPNQTPSSDVRHCASPKDDSADTVAEPLGVRMSRPLLPLHSVRLA